MNTEFQKLVYGALEEPCFICDDVIRKRAPKKANLSKFDTLNANFWENMTPTGLCADFLMSTIPYHSNGNFGSPGSLTIFAITCT